jgi:DNA-binding HxlR family transcriptional regulator
MTARVCSIARTLEVVGERWSLLVLREVLLGNRRFEAIAAATGAPRAVLTARLRTLEQHGLLTLSAYREPGQRARTEYRPTPAARELQPVLTALTDWGDRYLSGADGPPARTTHRDCGAPVHSRLRCEHGHDVGPRDVRVAPTLA